MSDIFSFRLLDDFIAKYKDVEPPFGLKLNVGFGRRRDMIALWQFGGKGRPVMGGKKTAVSLLQNGENGNRAIGRISRIFSKFFGIKNFILVFQCLHLV